MTSANFPQCPQYNRVMINYDPIDLVQLPKCGRVLLHNLSRNSGLSNQLPQIFCIARPNAESRGKNPGFVLTR